MKSELKRLRENNHHLGIINRFAVAMLALHTEEEILWHVARQVVAQLGFVDVVIYLLDDKDCVLRQRAAFGDKNPREYEILDPIEIRLGDGVVGEAALSGKALLIDDTTKFPGYIPDDAVRLSELAVPIKDGEKVLGVMDSEHPEAGFYTQVHLDTLSTVASMTATKLRQIRTVVQLEQTVELLEYGKRLQEALFRIAELSVTSESVDEFLGELHQCIGELTYAKNFSIALEADEGHGIQYQYVADEKEVLDTSKVYPVSPNRPALAPYILRSGKSVLLNKKEIETLVRKGVISAGRGLPASLIGVPFGSDSQRRGIVIVKSYDASTLYQEKDRSLLQFVSKHIHNAIERARARHNLTYLALHDSLTGLPNRSLFMDRLQHALDLCDRQQSDLLGVLFLDLDRFKSINDRYGHQVGDKFLSAVAERVAGCLRGSDTLCRLGGDEFAILIESPASRSEVLKVAERVLDAVVDPVWIDGIRISTTTSIGLTCSDQGNSTAEMLLREADEAMYQAKAKGRNQCRVFEKSESGPRPSTHRVERDLVDAIPTNQLYLVYQPLLELGNQTIIGAESLIRWQHPEHGLVAPAQFIPDAERTGLISDIDIAVVRMALRWLSSMQPLLPVGFRLGINLSGQSLISSSVMGAIQELIVEKAGVAERICFEITERAIVENLDDARRSIERLGSMGIQVALDDFGTGYSSLSYLNKLPLDTLKIDRSFIGKLEVDESNRTIVETIVVMARALNMTTVAEGIENQEQSKQLIKVGCDMGQGFYFSPPVADEAFRGLLKSGCSPTQRVMTAGST